MSAKMIFLDLDGTLFDDQKKVPEANIQAIADALAAGHKVFICTGRPLYSTRQLFPVLCMEKEGCYAITGNGTLIYDIYHQKAVYKNMLTVDQVSHIFQKAREWNIYMQAYSEKEILCEKDTKEGQYYTRVIGTPRRIVEHAAAALNGQGAFKTLALAPDFDHSRLEAFRDSFQDWAGSNADIFFSCYEFLEFVPKGINKGSGIRFMADFLHIPLENTIAVGDAENDIPMIRAAGIGVAMQNASEEIKSAADYVTVRTNNEGGVAEVIYKFML